MPRLADIMRPEPIVVAPEDTLGEVAERMTAVNVGAVIVKDFGRLIGILTERDMLKAMAARVHTSEARVRQWMTEEPITAAADADAEEAAQIMLERGFRHLPVVDETGSCDRHREPPSRRRGDEGRVRAGLIRRQQADAVPRRTASEACATVTRMRLRRVTRTPSRRIELAMLCSVEPGAARAKTHEAAFLFPSTQPDANR